MANPQKTKQQLQDCIEHFSTAESKMQGLWPILAGSAPWNPQDPGAEHKKAADRSKWTAGQLMQQELIEVCKREINRLPASAQWMQTAQTAAPTAQQTLAGLSTSTTQKTTVSQLLQPSAASTSSSSKHGQIDIGYAKFLEDAETSKAGPPRLPTASGNKIGTDYLPPRLPVGSGGSIKTGTDYLPPTTFKRQVLASDSSHGSNDNKAAVLDASTKYHAMPKGLPGRAAPTKIFPAIPPSHSSDELTSDEEAATRKVSSGDSGQASEIVFIGGGATRKSSLKRRASEPDLGAKPYHKKIRQDGVTSPVNMAALAQAAYEEHREAMSFDCDDNYDDHDEDEEMEEKRRGPIQGGSGSLSSKKEELALIEEGRRVLLDPASRVTHLVNAGLSLVQAGYVVRALGEKPYTSAKWRHEVLEHAWQAAGMPGCYSVVSPPSSQERIFNRDGQLVTPVAVTNRKPEMPARHLNAPNKSKPLGEYLGPYTMAEVEQEHSESGKMLGKGWEKFNSMIGASRPKDNSQVDSFKAETVKKLSEWKSYGDGLIGFGIWVIREQITRDFRILKHAAAT